MSDLISRQAVIEEIRTYITKPNISDDESEIKGFNDGLELAISVLSVLPSAEPETRTFVELVVEYPDPELCAYKEFKGKPYYSIKYIENGETYVGYGTYNPEVLSQYLREYFMPSAQPEHATCYLDSPCEYQNVNIELPSVEGEDNG